MRLHRTWVTLSAVVCAWLVATGIAAAEEKMLFDFESDPAIQAWTNVDVPALREAEGRADVEARRKAAADPATVPDYRPPNPPPTKEPPVQIESSPENATSGQRSLKLTFGGGRFPTISTASPVADWTAYKSFRADVTVQRTCMVIFRAMNEASRWGVGYNEGVSRWEKAARLVAGKNSVVAVAPEQARYRNTIIFQIYMFEPRAGETIYVDNIRLSTEAAPVETPFCDVGFNPKSQFRVLGTDLVVPSINDLADQLKDKWVKPEDKTIEQGVAYTYEIIACKSRPTSGPSTIGSSRRTPGPCWRSCARDSPATIPQRPTSPSQAGRTLHALATFPCL